MTETMTGTFASACGEYARAGWPAVIPVPPERKFPPPEGFTGAAGQDTPPELLAAWAGSAYADYSVALRMPEGVVGIDVDEYAKGDVVKHGAATVAAAEAELGPLPPTYTSTARGPGPSGIRFYRVPPGRYAGQLGPDVEIIQRHHRYAVVAPSPHAGAGAQYQWYGPDGSPLNGTVPRPDELPWLPEAWVRRLAEGAAAAGPEAAGTEAGAALLAHLTGSAEPPCVAMAAALHAAVAACSAAEAGSRHDAMTGRVYEIVMLAAEGHPGCADVLGRLAGLWDQLTAGEGREGEFSGPSGFLITAARKAATVHGPAPVRFDSCLAVNSQYQPHPAPAPDGAPDTVPPPVEAPRYWSPFEAIGTEPFEPRAELDAPLARDVLARTWPALRYAPDAGAWIVRGPERWDVRKGDLAKWATDLVSWLMLPGDPAAPEGSDAWRQAKKRSRFSTSASSNGIAGKMNAQVAAGHHPSTVELAALDGEREILWAGGVAYDLRLSADHPEPSRVTDKGTPHLHSAGVVPEAGPAPLWDALTAAVWPDAKLRAWALRVLSVAFTGYPDKALPILLGETDTGKTSLLTLLMSVLGSYAHTADARLLAPADKSHASIVYALRGRRLSFIDEAPRTGQLATERLKQITGGAELTGNRMGENPVTFAPTHTLILTANPEHEPVLTDAAIRRRVRLIPCDGDPEAVRAARAAIGNGNSPAWRAEAPAVLAMMMREAALWLADPASANSATAPESAARAVVEIMAGQDLVLSWLGEECEDWEPGTKSRDLYMAFTDSCRRMAVSPSQIPSETRWGKRLTDLGYPPSKRANANYRQLRIHLPQGFFPLPSELSGASGGSSAGTGQKDGGLKAGNGGLMDGQGLSAQPSTNGNGAGQTIHQTPHMEGMEGTQETTAPYAHARTHTRTQGGMTPTLHTFHPSTEPGAETGLPAPEPDSPPVTENTESKQKRERKPKAPKREGPDPELEGPVLPLPVLVARDPEGGVPLVLPCSPEQARAAAGPYLDALSVDCETSGFPLGHPDYVLRLVQLGGEHMAAVLDPSDEAQREVIADLLARARKLHAHSAAADLVPLAAAGLADADALWAKMEDSVLISKLGDPGLAGSDENQLKKLALALLGGYAVSPPAEKAKNELFKSGKWLVQTKPLTPREKSGWAMVKPGCETFARYAGSDVLDLAAAVRVLPRPDEAVLAREREFQAVCTRVAHRGFRLDPDHVRAKITEFTAAREAARERAHELCPAIANPSSTTEVPAALAALGIPLERTKPSKKFPQGQLSASKDTLKLLAQPGYEHTELLSQILEYRHDVTTLGLLLEPLNVLCERGDGRMRPVVYTINADTGRTSCVRPNGQQFSRQGGIRACVIADEGMMGISADFSGVEIRVGAALSGDADLLAAEMSTRCLACGADPCSCGKNQTGLHWMAARMAFGPGATKEDRYNSKRIIFSKMFGGGPRTGAAQVGLPEEAGRAVHGAFEAIAPRFAAWDRQMRAYSEAGGRSFQAYSGRTIWLPRGRAHAAGNYAIQGTARELLVDGVLKWQRTPWGHEPLLPIHDEVFLFVRRDEARAALEVLKACMRNELYGVPIEAAADEPFLAWPDSS